MSDNPDIFNLGVESSGFDDLTSSIDAVNERLQSTRSLLDVINQVANEQQTAFEQSMSSAKGSAEAQNDWNESIRQSASAFEEAADAGGSFAERIGQARQAADDLDESLKHVVEDTQQWQGYLAQGQDPYGAYSKGYGASGGMIGPAEEGEDDGGGGGSLFGVARGLRAGAGIGRLVGAGGATTGALTGAADILYLEQAFSKLSDILPGVGAAVEGFGSQLIGIVPAFEGLGVTGAGMVAVLGPMVALVGAAAAGIAIFNEEIKASKAALDEAISRTNTFYKTVQEGTTESINAELTKLQDQKNAQQEELDLDQANYDRQMKALDDQGNSLGAIALQHSALADNINKLKGEIPATQGQIEGLNDALGSTQVAARDAAAALSQVNDNLIKEVNNKISQSKQFDADDQLTMDAAQKKLTALERDRKAQQDAAEQLSNFAYANALSGEALKKNQDAVTAHMDQANADTAEINHLTDVSLGLIQAHKDEAQAVKDADEANKSYQTNLKNVIDAQNAYDKAIQAARDNLNNATSNLFYKERASEQQYTPGSEQDTFARDTIALKEQRDVSKIELDTSDKIADIRTKLGEKESQITTDYNRQIFDDQIKFQQDVQKLVTNEHNQEQIDAIDHANKLADIRQKSMIDEADDVANRDFIKLAKDQQTQQTSIQKEDQSFALKEENQRTHLAQQEQDLATALANQEKQQQVVEGRKIADAQLAADNAIAQQKADEQRKIDAARTAEQQQLDDLERNNLQKITLLRQQAYNEYELQVIQENQREQLALQTQQAIVSQNQAIMQAGTNAYIDDLNRLNQMAYNGGSTSAVSIPASNTVPAPSQWGVLNPPAQQQTTQQSSGGGFDLNAAAASLAGAIQGALFGS